MLPIYTIQRSFSHMYRPVYICTMWQTWSTSPTLLPALLPASSLASVTRSSLVPTPSPLPVYLATFLRFSLTGVSVSVSASASVSVNVTSVAPCNQCLSCLERDFRSHQNYRYRLPWQPKVLLENLVMAQGFDHN